MAKAARSTLPPVVDPTDEDEYGDELTEAEARQAEVGTLFTIQGPEFEDVSWSIHRYRTKHEIALDPNGKPEAWVADISGELKGSELVDLLGGGTFHFYGHVPKANGGVKIKYNKIVTLEGPRKNFSEAHDVVTPYAATNGTTMSAAEVELVRLRAQLRRERREREKAEAKREIDDRFTRMESLIERAMARPEPPPPQRDKLSDLIGAVVSLKQLDGNGTGQSEAMKMVFDSFRQGLELGTTREPVPMDGTDPNPTWIPAALGVLEKFLATMAARRPVPGGAPRPATAGAPPPPPPRSEATVVETPEPAPNAPIADEVPPQWRTACASLFRAMTNGVDPRDFASSLRDMLNPDEVKSLLHASADDVLGYMRGLNLLTQYPALETEQGKVYLTDVLAGLRANEEEAAAAQ